MNVFDICEKDQMCTRGTWTTMTENIPSMPTVGIFLTNMSQRICIFNIKYANIDLKI